MKLWQKLNQIFVKIGILQEAPFINDRASNCKSGKITSAQYPKEFITRFYQIWSRGWGEMASDEQRDGRTDRRTERRTDRRSGDSMLDLRGA